MRALVVWLALAQAAYADAPLGELRAPVADSGGARPSLRAARLHFDVRMEPPDGFFVRLFSESVRLVRTNGKTVWKRALPPRWRKVVGLERTFDESQGLESRVAPLYHLLARADGFVIVDEEGLLVLDRDDGHTRFAWDYEGASHDLSYYDHATLTIDAPNGRCTMNVGTLFLVQCNGRLYWSSDGAIAVFDAADYHFISKGTFKERGHASERNAAFDADGVAGDARLALRAFIFD